MKWKKGKTQEDLQGQRARGRRVQGEARAATTHPAEAKGGEQEGEAFRKGTRRKGVSGAVNCMGLRTEEGLRKEKEGCATITGSMSRKTVLLHSYRIQEE